MSDGKEDGGGVDDEHLLQVKGSENLIIYKLKKIGDFQNEVFYKE